MGPVATIRVFRDNQSRQSLGYAYINFHIASDADRAFHTMNFKIIRGKECQIIWLRQDLFSSQGVVFVQRLHECIGNKTLHDTFSVFGTVFSCNVMTDQDTGISKGYGYVHFTQDEDAQKAIEGVCICTYTCVSFHSKICL